MKTKATYVSDDSYAVAPYCRHIYIYIYPSIEEDMTQQLGALLLEDLSSIYSTRMLAHH